MSALDLREKLAILADAAKYDASCASSGSAKRDSRGGKGMGSTEGMGICHAYAPDGRCISLLKILLTNSCIFDCHYCINRKSSNVRRARFTPPEVVRLTLDFYKRNYIEGLFLSSGIIRSPDYTMEQIVEVARALREDHDFRGYIHLKTIPDADPELVRLAGVHADRVSINVELPTARGLQRLAPDKDGVRIEAAMKEMRTAIEDGAEAKQRYRSAPAFAPAGQSTQMIVGADSASDGEIIDRSAKLYDRFRLRRVYYSAFSPIPDGSAVLPLKRPPLMREHRLYQSDWLMRFPVDVNRAPRELMLRVPGLGVKAVDRLIASRRQRRVRLEDVARLTASIAKVRPFIEAEGWRPTLLTDRADLAARLRPRENQLELFGS
jgi:putative DNA modification/repair radical SAM protein